MTTTTIRSVMNELTQKSKRVNSDRLVVVIGLMALTGFLLWAVGITFAIIFGFETSRWPFIVFLVGAGFIFAALISMAVSTIVDEIRLARNAKR